jgi:hypothetical protein
MCIPEIHSSRTACIAQQVLANLGYETLFQKKKKKKQKKEKEM